MATGAEDPAAAAQADNDKPDHPAHDRPADDLVTERGLRPGWAKLRALKGRPTGEYGSSEELVHVRNRGCIAAVSPGIVAVIRL